MSLIYICISILALEIGSSVPFFKIPYICINIWDSLVAQLVKNCLQFRRPQFNSWVRKIPWRRDRLPTSIFLGFPGGSAGKESACNAEDLVLILGLERCPGEGNSYPHQYFGLENSMDCIVHGVAKIHKKTIIQKDTCTSMFIAALFSITKIKKQPKCPSTSEWIKKM